MRLMRTARPVYSQSDGISNKSLEASLKTIVPTFFHFTLNLVPDVKKKYLMWTSIPRQTKKKTGETGF